MRSIYSKERAAFTGGVLMLLVALAFLSPFYFVLINSVKTDAEYLVSKIALPSSVSISDTYGKTIQLMKYGRVLGNSVFVTFFSVAGLVIFGAMAAYKLARVEGKLSTFIFYLFLSIMVIPFQVVMIPIVVMTRRLGLMNSLIGIVLVYWGLVAPPAIFLYHGFVKTIPREIEESFFIDGANGYQTFWHLVFPLLKPITSTVIVLMGLQVWNDFMLPLLLLQKPRDYTLPLSTMRFFQTYNTAWSNLLSAIVLASLPMVIFFFFMQRYVISGITSGAMKG